MIAPRIEKLTKQDYPPTILFVRDKKGKLCKPILCTSRNGNSKGMHISKTVAAELIAAGFGYGT